MLDEQIKSITPPRGAPDLQTVLNGRDNWLVD